MGRLDDELAELLSGLSERPPRVSARYFYDARGSALFDEITTLPEYYPTRTELGILAAVAAEIGELVPTGVTMVELGSGSATKALRVLAGLHRPAAFRPIDVSPAALDATVRGVHEVFPDLQVQGLVGDFTAAGGYADLADSTPLLVFYPGSTIGNLHPPDAEHFLGLVRDATPPGTQLLLGVDLVKDARVIEAAYDDSRGVTATFNRNLLAHLHARFGADFVPERWRHHALFDPDASRVEMHLVSECDQDVHVGGRRFHFAAGDSIWTESSYKYTPDALTHLAERAGWSRRRWWTDARAWFGVGLFDS